MTSEIWPQLLPLVYWLSCDVRATVVGRRRRRRRGGGGGEMYSDVSSCKKYNYGDAQYWDQRYLEDGENASFDWYQRYSDLRPFIRKFVPTKSTVLMVGCGNAVISEDMVRDGYEDIMNIDISSAAINMMKNKYARVPQLKYKQMDVRDMSYFADESFDSIIDKGTLDSLMCGFNAPISASLMLEEVSRLLRPEGVYILITYGDPSVRIPHLNRLGSAWKITLFVLQRPGYHREEACSSSSKSYMEPVPLSDTGLLPSGFVLDDPDSHYVYVCKKIKGSSSPSCVTSEMDKATPLH